MSLPLITTDCSPARTRGNVLKNVEKINVRFIYKFCVGGSAAVNSFGKTSYLGPAHFNVVNTEKETEYTTPFYNIIICMYAYRVGQ